LGAVVVPAVGLGVVTAGGKLVSGWLGAGRHGAGARGRLRAGSALIARGEFSIVIAAVGAGAAKGQELGALAAAYVLFTAVVGPLAAKYADRIPVPRRLERRAAKSR
jgi:CPA2 family monovalent cation:H+ antiporter-2